MTRIITPIISIIIPVYNTEKYLEQCIDSIINQSFKDYEIILVNDGSTDNSKIICNEYSEAHAFISVIHKKNGGLSDARNTGIKAAKGQYILFIDSDDYIEKDSLSEINKTLYEDPEVDVIFLEATKFYENGSMIPMGDSYKKNLIIGKSHEDVLIHITSLPKFPASACTKLVKREIILTRGLFFCKGLLSEDLDWTINLLMVATRYNYCASNYYYYRQGRSNSITNSLGIKNINSFITIFDKWTQKNIPLPSEQYRKYIHSFLAYEYMIAVMCYARLSYQERSVVKNTLKKYSWLLSFNDTKKVRVTRFIYMRFGLRLTSLILMVFLGLRARYEAI